MKTSHNRKTSALGFTLIELLVVIAIIGVLAGLILPVGAMIKRKAALNRAKTELQKVALAISSYQAKLGHYPPDNPNNLAINQLYFELVGVKPVGNLTTRYDSLDGNASIDSADFLTFYGNPNITGFVNSGVSGDENTAAAVKFLSEITPAQYLEFWKNPSTISGAVLGTQVKGPLMLTNSVGKFINPFRYNSSSPTNNVNSFDLWVDIDQGGKTVRICNWSETPIINP